MAQTYLLTTPDGEEVHVESSQAGETITTASGKTVEVPTLRELKKLPLVEKEEVPTRREWSVGQSILFVVGLLLLIGCSVSTAFLYRITPLESLDKAREVPLELIEGDVEKWSMQDKLSFWAFASSGKALNDMRGNASIDRKVLGVYESRQTFLLLSVVGVVLGLILMGSAFAFSGKSIS